jgi:hypothetical protein
MFGNFRCPIHGYREMYQTFPIYKRPIKEAIGDFIFDHLLALCIVGIILCLGAVAWLSATGNFDSDSFWMGFNASQY